MTIIVTVRIKLLSVFWPMLLHHSNYSHTVSVAGGILAKDQVNHVRMVIITRRKSMLDHPINTNKYTHSMTTSVSTNNTKKFSESMISINDVFEHTSHTAEAEHVCVYNCTIIHLFTAALTIIIITSFNLLTSSQPSYLQCYNNSQSLSHFNDDIRSISLHHTFT